MLFPIRQLLKKGSPLCVDKTKTVRDALTLMIENDFSQLPVINEHGNLIGLISEASIIQTYFHIDTTISLLDLNVDHCMASPKTTSPESDIFEALSLLENVYAIVVVDNQKPIGILTDYDTTHFFRDLSEGLIIVEDIEVTLRQYIESIFSDVHMMDAALMRAFKENKKDPTRPAKEYEGLTFGDHIQLIITEANWDKFASYFAPKELFTKFMSEVGIIRNQLAHFRGKLEPLQLNALLRARDWLSTRPKTTALLKEIVGTAEITLEDVTLVAVGGGKYDPLRNWFIHRHGDSQTRLRLRFEQIEELINQKLPDSARSHRSWWANDPATHSQSLSWIAAGWVVDDVDFSTEEVTFRQTNLAFYYTFFSDLLARLKSIRPGITQTQKASLQNWLSFGSGVAGFGYAWALPREPVLRVELYIDKGDKAESKAAFERLMQAREQIEEEIGGELDWDRMEKSRSCRISKSIPFHITYTPVAHEKAKQWGIEMMLKLVDAFQPRLREL